MDQSLAAAYQYAYSSNLLYNDNKQRWQFLLQSYLGGEAYRKGAHLTKYQLESAAEYSQRLNSTPLDNHCKSIVATYISFLFRLDAERELGTWADNPQVQAFIDDADLEGSELDDFMKQVSTWALVFGHSWILLTKPNVNAVTVADELAAGVRPYASVLTPLTVLDWRWQRTAAGGYRLVYFKYIEDANDQLTVIREWTLDEIKTWEANERKKEAQVTAVEPNQLGEIPAVLCYGQRGLVRGLGISVIDDIADQQRAIYNELSEVEQTIRLEGHPSIVVTPDVQYGNGAGAVVIVPNDLDSGLKPYMLNVDAVPVEQIYKSIKNRVESIDKMANTGSIRSTETAEMSGVAREVEFQMLNAKLSEIADNIELAEKQMWWYFGAYQQLDYTEIDIDYPDSFSVRDTGNEYKMLSEARNSSGSTESQALIDLRLRQLLDDPRIEGLTDEEALAISESQPMVDAAVQSTAPMTSETVMDTQGLTPEQLDQYNFQEGQVAKNGPYDPGVGPHGAHYAPGSANPFQSQGLVCGNCVFYQTGGACEIVSGQIDPAGICKFWIIPENRLNTNN